MQSVFPSYLNGVDLCSFSKLPFDSRRCCGFFTSPGRWMVFKTEENTPVWKISRSKTKLKCIVEKRTFFGFSYRKCGWAMQRSWRIRNLSDSCTSEKKTDTEFLSGLGEHQSGIGVCETRTLPAVLSIADAIDSLRFVVADLQSKPPILTSGILRFQVPLAPGIRALEWLQSQCLCPHLLPRCYFSPRNSPSTGFGFAADSRSAFNGIAGVGCAVLFKGFKPFSSRDWRSLRRFLSSDSPLIRAYGAIRFDAEMEPSPEWKSFGSFYFVIPQIEFCECPSCSLLAVTIAWDNALKWKFNKALGTANRAICKLSDQVSSKKARRPLKVLKKEHIPCEHVWHESVKRIIESLKDNQANDFSSSESQITYSAFIERMKLSKVVLARRTELEVDTAVDPLTLLASLQEKDSVAYQFCIQNTDGSAFIGNTPECLFYKDRFTVISEAVAATRPRGMNDKDDFQISMDLLLSGKDNLEFAIVRDSVRQRMEMVCKHVEVVSHKDEIKQAEVQHLYSCLIGQLHNEANECDILSALHPTPAVCGEPQRLAKDIICQTEMFDRGMYAGPVGWIGGDKAEFAVGIRSSLVEPCGYHSLERYFSQGTRFYMYAGAGIVKGSESASEWMELNLKINQFESLLQPFPPLNKAINVNAIWARLIVEECCRLGVIYFCIGPGSRSSPLAIAAAENSGITCVSCIDERSLGFHALGYGRGSCKPAAVITSSGTAVSNLLPAVVEASQDCVPLLLLTADRPPELQDTGANQTINQDNHFGIFVRYSVNLPAADDKVPARMVLTSIDSAVFRASTEPFGPVHVNCPFREPLAGLPDGWKLDCLRGLEAWAAGSFPFTKYMKNNFIAVSSRTYPIASEMREVIGIVNLARRGLLVVGGLHMVEEVWSTLLLAEYLAWPVMPDILSGLRLRQIDRGSKDNVHIIDNFNHILPSMTTHDSLSPDVILQIGSRLTSKGLTHFLEACQPFAHILVEEHPYRHDPSHMLTHRVQSSVMHFVAVVKAFCSPSQPHDFSEKLKALSKIAAQEISVHFQTQCSLSEPLVAQIVAKSVMPGSALFLGNSMAIRDVDMYAEGEVSNCTAPVLSVLGVQTVGNRGASGIDGVLSTSIGFAAGSKQRVTLLLGDLSFLHDTNGLALLAERGCQPAVTVVVVNNFGGGIFSLLPVANTTAYSIFTKFFSTPHDVSIHRLCLAHRVNHMLVKTNSQLEEALCFARQQQQSWVIEVESNIEENAEFHRFVQASVLQTVNQSFQLMNATHHMLGLNIFGVAEIQEISYFHYRLPLLAKTTAAEECTNEHASREGFLLRITLSNGCSGFGETAPLEALHKENMRDVEEQLRILVQFLKGVQLNATVALLNGSFSDWLLNKVGLMPDTLLPTVRCCLEMAVLGALSSCYGCNITDLLYGDITFRKKNVENTAKDVFSHVRICALIDSAGAPEDVAASALELVKQGFCTLKIKVGRRASPLDDAAAVRAVRDKVGPNVQLRADANRHWTFEQALEFANAVRDCGLQYLEEPTKVLQDISMLYKETGLPVALDESIDEYAKNLSAMSMAFSIPAVISAVIKPSSVGGFENAALIAKCAHRQGMIAVISAAFESSISLAVYGQFAAYVDRKQPGSISPAEDNGKKKFYQKNAFQTVAHGLGTYMWLGSDTVRGKRFQASSSAEGVNASIRDMGDVLQNIKLNMDILKPQLTESNITSEIYTIDSSGSLFSFHVLDTGDLKSNMEAPVLIFLHGFLGHGEDWLPVMHALSISYRCISIDLPGHGKTNVKDKFCDDISQIVTVGFQKLSAGSKFPAEKTWSIQNISLALSILFKQISQKKVALVGYSLGARLSLYMSLKFRQQIAAAVIISGNPGLQDPASQRERAEKDDALAIFLKISGLQSFVHSWYQKPLWESLRSHPRFKSILHTRMHQQNVDGLARVLSSLSLGRQPSLWEDLASHHIPLLFVAGKKDPKYVEIAYQICGIIPDSYYKPLTKSTLIKSVNNTFCSRFNKLANDETFPDSVGQDMKNFQLDETHSFVSYEHKIERNKSYRTECKTDSGKMIHEVENSGHAVHLENPLELVHAVRTFLNNLN